MNDLIDARERLEAIRVDKNYIVQAPAGSGKTELLTQRFLNLLNIVEEPEAIVALTFTRKAAGEMRERIITALREAQEPKNHQSPHKALTQTLAMRVLEHSQQRNWNLLYYPNRLQIQTLDSLAAHLAKQNPLLSESGGQFNLTEDPECLYQSAAKQVIQYIHNNENPYCNPLQILIEHLDVNLKKAERLLIEILQKREQWLPYLLKNDLQQVQREALTIIGKQSILALKTIDPLILEEWIAIGHYIGNQLPDIGLTQNDTLNTLLDYSRIGTWKNLINIILKSSDNEFRKALKTEQGFPAQSNLKSSQEKKFHKHFKERALQLIQHMASNSEILSILLEVRRTPVPEDFQVIRPLLNALAKILPVLIAELKYIFQSKNIIDFNELTSLAHKSLGDDYIIGDALLKTDHRIKHLLIDEFQDTSISQYQLLEKIVQGWEENDGRTIFFVGDPMQSIYRFRQAEVGLFLHVQEKGFSKLAVHPLYLKSNFRSSPYLVDWTNKHFSKIFPQKKIPHLGAVHFNPSYAALEHTGQIDISLFTEEKDEAHFIADFIEKFKNSKPDQTLAILVRSRNHVQTIASILKERNISFNATELEQITSHMLIDDLYSLTRVVLFPEDRLAWLSLLRGPWCGLPLTVLSILADKIKEDLSHSLLKSNSGILNELDNDSSTRLRAILTVVESAHRLVKIIPVAELIQATWCALGGKRLLHNPDQETKIAEMYFKNLEKLDDPYTLESIEYFYKKISNQYMDSNAELHSNVHIMTIHKSKGLEFDCVIIPQISKKTGRNTPTILRWSEFADSDAVSYFLLAPIKNHSEDKEPIHDYLDEVDKIRHEHELKRLFYVAVTRAKHHLILTTSDSKFNEINAINPSQNTLFKFLYPHLDKDSINIQKYNSETTQPNNIFYLRQPPLSFIQNNFHSVRPDIDLSEKINPTLPIYSWHTAAGTVVHKIFSRLFKSKAEIRENLIKKIRNKSFFSVINKLLMQEIVNPEDMSSAATVVQNALMHTLECSIGTWLLAQKDVQTEYPVIHVQSNKPQLQIIDLTFIDNDGTRWIIDHKVIQNSQINSDSQKKIRQQYCSQLSRYAEAFVALVNRPIKLGLYLPLQTILIDWCYESQNLSQHSVK